MFARRETAPPSLWVRLGSQAVGLLGLGLLLAFVALRAGDAIALIPPMLSPGTPAPDLTLRVHGSRDLRSLRSYAGTATIVVFYTVYCPGCDVALPQLQMLADSLAAADVHVVAVNLGGCGSDTEVNAELARTGARFPILRDCGGASRTPFLVHGVPTMYLIDRDWVVRDRWVGLATDLTHQRPVVRWNAREGRAILDSLLSPRPERPAT